MKYAVYYSTFYSASHFVPPFACAYYIGETYNLQIYLRKIYNEWKGKPDFTLHGIINLSVSCVFTAANFRAFGDFVFASRKILINSFLIKSLLIIYIVHSHL